MAKPSKLKIMSILGTRPEIIRLSSVLKKMDNYFDHKIVYTNQSYDIELSKIFFEELGLRDPDYILEAKSDTLAGQIANILTQTETVMLKEKPDAILVLGDTNSALSTIIAKRLKIMIFHMEAGNRCFDFDVPEETNRRIADHVSDINLPYTENARRYLISEGVHPGSIYVTGSPMAEVLRDHKREIDNCNILTELKLESKKYFVVSTHREENVDNKERLGEIIESINAIAEIYQMPIIISLHPRTKNKVELFGLKNAWHPLVRPLKPLGFFEYNKLQCEALCVLSDSGTIPEESSILGFRAIQIRKSSERPEAFDTGSIVLTGHNKNTILTALRLVLEEEKNGIALVVPRDYQDINVSTKVVKIILGLTSIKKSQIVLKDI